MKLIGIDLGTTNSVIALVNEFGKPEIIPNKEGERTTPSVVLFDHDQVIVGSTAKQSAVADPENTIACIKSHIGSTDFMFTHNRVDFTPEDISAMILRKLIDDAENFLGEKISDVVITVPAYFNDIQRKATIDAGKIAGVNVMQIINEPTAAALTYGLDKKKAQTIIVYDLGGGTFDVTIMKIGENTFDVIGSDGDRKLGGNNFDDKLMAYLNQQFKNEHKIDLLEDLVLSQDLRIKSENAKKILSNKLSTTVYLSAQGRSSKIEITREIFAELVADLIARTQLLLEAVMDDARLDWSEIDQLLLVGGSTRTPAVYEMVKKVSGKEPSININPDEAVALGAAIQAGIINAREKDSNISDMVRMKYGSINVADVTAHSFGAITLDEYNNKRNAIIIPKNSKIPVRKSQIFYTTVPNQTSVKLTVLQGEDKDPEFCTILGTTTLEFPPKQVNSPIIFNYEYDVNGIINASAKDPETGKKSFIEIKREGALSGQEVRDKTDKLNTIIPKRRDFIKKDSFVEDEDIQTVPRAAKTVVEPARAIVSDLFSNSSSDDDLGFSSEFESRIPDNSANRQIIATTTRPSEASAEFEEQEEAVYNDKIDYFEAPAKKGIPEINAFNQNAVMSDEPLKQKAAPISNKNSDYESKIDYFSDMDLTDENDSDLPVKPNIQSKQPTNNAKTKHTINVSRSEVLTDDELNNLAPSSSDQAKFNMRSGFKSDMIEHAIGDLESTDPNEWEKILNIMKIDDDNPVEKQADNSKTTKIADKSSNQTAAKISTKSAEESLMDWINDDNN